MDRAAATVSRRYRRRPAVTCHKHPSQVRQGLFGFYLGLNIQELGDVDRTVTLTARPATNEPDTRQAYAQRSGRRFASVSHLKFG